MSSKSKPSTGSQSAGSKCSETMAATVGPRRPSAQPQHGSCARPGGTVTDVKDWLRSASAHTPDAPFLVLPGGASYSFGEVEEMTRRMVGALQGAGIGQGDRIALRPGNDAESVARMFAIPRMGATTVMINARLSEPEILWQLAHA